MIFIGKFGGIIILLDRKQTIKLPLPIMRISFFVLQHNNQEMVGIYTPLSLILLPT